MTIKVAINGFGRIGRCLARAIFDNNDSNLELVAINGPAAIETQIQLLKYDSIHGRFNAQVSAKDENTMLINGKEIAFTRHRDPNELNWAENNIDVVFECTGIFTSSDKAKIHLEKGAKKVLISAPAKSSDIKTIIYGVNDADFTTNDDIISVGSCTTNCLAPIAKILNDSIGIEKGFMTTIHSYTNDQNIVDGSHRDLRRARAAAISMIPTSTGAAKALGLVLPELKGKLDGGAIRVPTANVSMVDLNFVAKKEINAGEINEIVKQAVNSSNKMAKVVEYVTEPLVSIDFNHTTQSSCFDSTLTKVIGGNFVKVCSWYDNEWGFSQRMLDLALMTKNFS